MQGSVISFLEFVFVIFRRDISIDMTLGSCPVSVDTWRQLSHQDCHTVLDPFRVLALWQPCHTFTVANNLANA